MLDSFILSKNFDRNFFFLRKYIPFINRRYNYLHNINIKMQTQKEHSDLDELIAKAEAALAEIKNACTVEHNQLNIPKTIWLYWNSSLETAPDVVKHSLLSWKMMNPDYEICFLNDNNLNEVLGFNFNSVFQLASVNLGFAMKADILRLYLLSKFGGIWVDTTTFCLTPLNKWLPEATKQTNFFTFRHRNNHTRPIEAWFIAAPKGSPITKHTLSLFLNHLFKDRNITLYISNRIKRIGHRDNERERFFSDIVNIAEKKYFMPYFSVGYFFNSSLNQPESRTVWDCLQNKTNNHSINNDNFDTFRQSYVSKQTYKKDYQDGDIYQERVKYLKSILNQQ